MRILLIEDDTHTGAVIQSRLADENLHCHVCNTGQEALELLQFDQPDVIVLDLGLPGDVSGHEVLQKIRDALISTPILILSGYQSVKDKVKTLGVGADDYMTKPFSIEELIVRIRALARRAEGHASAQIRVGEIQLNLDARMIEVRGKPMSLTEKEYQILEFLMLRQGATLTKNNFLNRLYAGMDEPEAKIIDVFVCKIRKKLEDLLGASGREYIETIWGRGYVLRDPTKNTANSSAPTIVPVNASGLGPVPSAR